METADDVPNTVCLILVMSYNRHEPNFPHFSCHNMQELSTITPLIIGPGTVPVKNVKNQSINIIIRN